MSLAAVLATTGEIIGVANGLKSLAANPEKRKQLKPVIYALQSIYFTPKGLLTILRAIAQGQPPHREDIQAAVLEFNDGEWDVQRALLTLDYDELDRFDIPLGYRNRLQMAAYGKANLRRDLQDTINTRDGRLPLTQDQAWELVRRIEALNRAIESLDEALRG